MSRFDERTVIVIDTNDYRSYYSEKVPFKAIVQDVYDNKIVVKSIKSNREYELYYHQILESMDMEDVKKLLNLDNYGR